MILYILIGIVVFVFMFGFLYMTFSPQIGGKPSTFDSPNFVDGKFRNLVTTNLMENDASFWDSLNDYFFNKSKDRFPNFTIDTEKIDKDLKLEGEEVVINWLGHSTILIRNKDVTLITDPILHKRKIPPFYLGPKPFDYNVSYTINDLPNIDYVFISHDHYDHLDMQTIKELKGSKFFVPLGVKAHLLRWGIDEQSITELDWYENSFLDDIKLTLTPSRHFSGRSLSDRGKTLWGSFVIELSNKKIFFSGDSGYFDEFKKIGNQFGPFDLVMLDNAQYHKNWHSIHMFPEEAVQASIDLNAKQLLPIHWSKYVLSTHAWNDPINRAKKAGIEKGVNVVDIKVGENFMI
jgi:L-ascorbate metabolism protein UlaG (beta-lactamase superfamily)